MAKVLVTESYLSAIASAIRSKAGTTQTFTPAQMASAIDNLPSGNSLYKTVLERGSFLNGVFYDDQLSSIGNYAFYYYATGLTTLTLQAVTKVGACAFANCSRLVTVQLPACISILASAFMNCNDLRNLSLPVCQFIGPTAFYAPLDKMLDGVDVKLPACTTIMPGAFYGASMLTVDAPALTWIYSGTQLTSTDKTKSGGFQACVKLQAVYLSAISSIGAGAFHSCHMLTSLYILGSRVPTVGDPNAFSSTPIGGYSASAGQFGSVFVLPSMYSAFISATFWSTISSRIVSYVEG